MAHYAEVKDGVVIRVLVMDNDWSDERCIKWLNDNISLNDWVKTSYNTIGGVHKKGDLAFRGNYAGIGYNYSKEFDVFIPVKPYGSWVLNKKVWLWEAPVKKPNDGKNYEWNEEKQQWDELIRIN